MTISRRIHLRVRNVLDKSCRENQNTHFLFCNFFPKIASLLDNVEKCGGAREATNDNTAHARCILDKERHARAHMHTPTRPDTSPPHTSARMRKHAQTSPRARAHREMCNTSFFSMTTMVSCKRPNVLLYAHCLSCLKSL
jgi:hypothetical protein